MDRRERYLRSQQRGCKQRKCCRLHQRCLQPKNSFVHLIFFLLIFTSSTSSLGSCIGNNEAALHTHQFAREVCIHVICTAQCLDRECVIFERTDVFRTDQPGRTRLH